MENFDLKLSSTEKTLVRMGYVAKVITCEKVLPEKTNANFFKKVWELLPSNFSIKFNVF